MFADLSGLSAVFIGLIFIRPYINDHKKNGGEALSELINRSNRSLRLSGYILSISFLTLLYFLSIGNKIDNFNRSILYTLVLSCVFLFATVLVTIDHGLSRHNFFAKGFVILQLVAFVLFGINNIVMGKVLLGVILLLATSFYLLRLYRNSDHKNYPLRSIEEHTYLMYLFVFITLF